MLPMANKMIRTGYAFDSNNSFSRLPLVFTFVDGPHKGAQPNCIEKTLPCFLDDDGSSEAKLLPPFHCSFPFRVMGKFATQTFRMLKALLIVVT